MRPGCSWCTYEKCICIYAECEHIQLAINTMFLWKLMPTPENDKPGTNTGPKDHANHEYINCEVAKQQTALALYVYIGLML